MRDLARALNAEAAVLAVVDEASESVEVLAAWGVAAGNDDLPSSVLADGFAGRALGLERATVEPLDGFDRALGQLRLPAETMQVASAPLQPLRGPRGVLCVALPADPFGAASEAETLWRLERYAQLAELCLSDPQALEALLSGGHVDGLTGCLTQVAFFRELRREIARSSRHDLRLSCAFLDVDGFKRVNDRHGHLYGSRLLADIATVLRAGIRREDTVGRYGGDEFVLLLPDTDETAAIELAERLRQTIHTTLTGLPDEPLDASIGIAQWQSGTDAEALLDAADQALLNAKRAGGATVTATTLSSPQPAQR